MPFPVLSCIKKCRDGWRRCLWLTLCVFASFTESGGYDLSNQIQHIHHPTLILWGTADAMRFLEATLAVSTEPRAGSRLVWIEKAGHAPHLDQPHAVAAQILG